MTWHVRAEGPLINTTTTLPYTFSKNSRALARQLEKTLHAQIDNKTARPSGRLLAEILWLQFDGGAVGCAVGGAPPGIAVTREFRLVAQTLVGD